MFWKLKSSTLQKRGYLFIGMAYIWEVIQTQPKLISNKMFNQHYKALTKWTGQSVSPNVLSSQERASRTTFQYQIKKEPFGKHGRKYCNLSDCDWQIFRYHAHSEVQRGDGLYGGLIVHRPSSMEKLYEPYDEELLFLVGDWYHRPAAQILAWFQDRTSMGNEVCCLIFVQWYTAYNRNWDLLPARPRLPPHQWHGIFRVLKGNSGFTCQLQWC